MKRKGNGERGMGNGKKDFFHCSLILLFLFFSPLLSQAQTRPGPPFLVPQTIFVGDPGRLVVPLGRLYSGLSPFVVEAPNKLPETSELLIRRIELERRGEFTRLLIDFVPYAPGTLSLPALEILVPGGDPEPLLFTDLEVQVASILDPSQMTLSEPVSPMAVPGTSFLIYGTIVLLLFLLCLGIVISLWSRSHFREF